MVNGTILKAIKNNAIYPCTKFLLQLFSGAWFVVDQIVSLGLTLIKGAPF